MHYKDIYQYISEQVEDYKLPIEIEANWHWNMAEHIRVSTLYINGKFATGTGDRPFKNITLPILNLQKRAEGFDVKDILLYINSAKDYLFKSFLVRKFHEKWARENAIDTFLDDMVSSYVDYGGSLLKNTKDVKPEVIPLQSIAFCDQTDILSGPFALKHQYSPDQLREVAEKGKWDMDEVEVAITLAQKEHAEKATTGNVKKNNTPGKYIEVYEVHGCLPSSFLGEKYEYEDEEYVAQLQICTFQKDEKNSTTGTTLYRGVEKELPFKMIKRDKIFGRALGRGGAEELFEPQVWVNYDMIRMKDLLDSASKVLHWTDDPSFANRNKTNDLDNGEILVGAAGTTFRQVDTVPRNIQLFNNAVQEWEQNARQVGAATESIMGESPTAGTPFKLQELITAESHSLHEFRKGQLATAVDEIYMDWIIRHIADEITKGDEFLADLDFDEMQYVADSLVTCETNKVIKEKILNGEQIYDADVENYKQLVRDSFTKGGNKKFITILKDELKDSPISIKTNIVGKQKDLAGKVDKLTNIFRTIIAAPGILDDPRMAKLFNQIIEISGLEAIDFYQKPQVLPQPTQPNGAPVAPPQFAMQPR